MSNSHLKWTTITMDRDDQLKKYMPFNKEDKELELACKGVARRWQKDNPSQGVKFEHRGEVWFKYNAPK